MKRLVILRHAKADKERRGRGDFERPLSERGETDALAIGRVLVRHALHPGAIVASPARRTLETARIVARELDFPWAEIRTGKEFYLAGAETLLEALRGLEDEVRSALLVGHNPGVTDLAGSLARGLTEDLPTCAAVALDLAIDTWGVLRPGAGSLLWYEVPARHW